MKSWKWVLGPYNWACQPPNLPLDPHGPTSTWTHINMDPHHRHSGPLALNQVEARTAKPSYTSCSCVLLSDSTNPRYKHLHPLLSIFSLHLFSTPVIPSLLLVLQGSAQPPPPFLLRSWLLPTIADRYALTFAKGILLMTFDFGITLLYLSPSPSPDLLIRYLVTCRSRPSSAPLLTNGDDSFSHYTRAPHRSDLPV